MSMVEVMSLLDLLFNAGLFLIALFVYVDNKRK